MVVNRNEIMKKLSLLKSVTPKSIAGWNGILVDGNTLTANNLEYAVKTVFDSENTEKFVLPSKAIDIIDKLPDKEIEIKPTASGKSVSIISNTGKSQFSTIDVCDFPAVDIPEPKQDAFKLTIDAEDFTDALSSVMYACSDKEDKPAPQRGVLFEGHDGKLNIVSCDGANLACNEIDYQGKMYCIVPKNVLKKMLSIDFGNFVTFYADESKVIFKTGDYIVQSLLITGNFIQYGTVFKQAPKIQIEADRVELIKAFERVSTIIGSDKVPAKISRNGNELTISCKTSTAQYEENVEAEFDGEGDILIGLNPNFAVSCLKSSIENRITLGYISEVKQLMVTSENFKAVILPVRL